MPRIRKKTSKRGTTNQREKIKHKVSETRKKRKKESKKKPQQWKSKHPKDPGIPNNFPYKDQILAEVAEQRRQAEEAKQRRKEEKKAARTDGNGEEDQAPTIGVTTLHDQQAASGSSKTKIDKDVSEDAPILMNSDLPNLKAVLDQAHVVLEVLDARDPLACRSSFLEEYVKSKSGIKLALVLNKIDACPREAVQSWATTLQDDHPTFLFRTASGFLPSSDSGKGKAKANDALGADSLLEYLAQCAEESGKEEPLVVAVVGLTNVGKSSLVNSLTQQSVLPIYALSSTQVEGPTTTPYAQEVPFETSGYKFRVIDTPGISWQADDEDEQIDEGVRAKDILTRSRGRIDRLKDPLPVVASIVTRANKEDLMLFYNIPAFSEGDTQGFLTAVARSNNLIKRGGEPDSTGASRIVLRDWGTGKLPRYSTPSLPHGQTTATLGSKVESLLSKLVSRKELRKTSGLVKVKPSEIDTRKVELEKSWIKEMGSNSDGESEEDEDEDEEEGDGAVGSDEEEDVDSDGVDEEDSEDSDEEDSLTTGKRKRGPLKAPIKPAKKVAFATELPKRRRGAPTPTAKVTSRQATPLKPSTKTPKKAISNPLVKAAKTANSSSSKTAMKNANANGEEAYDFGKFF